MRYCVVNFALPSLVLRLRWQCGHAGAVLIRIPRQFPQILLPDEFRMVAACWSSYSPSCALERCIRRPEKPWQGLVLPWAWHRGQSTPLGLFGGGVVAWSGWSAGGRAQVRVWCGGEGGSVAKDVVV